MGEPLDIFGRPVEDRRLVICTGPCCDRDGQASENLAALKNLLIRNGLSEETIGLASCVRRNCLGKCCSEPLARVTPDDVWYHELTGENLLRIFEQHVLKRLPVAELVLPPED
ncbi:ferredoxin [Methylosinus sp. Sm6]|uniref:(2Fe-2S) ferredoxin domain-containing protein n=1 Tax=Methylosinus sp. Sm6 TaxID=2866948 RepID=UPI001C9A0E0E|nr:(2Fe-2S) ferredoxin domain-containing protein [Methylosinus sp. Sm6]MBY6240227.1 (2Fe-2S) ferredoxin domain-containing protein [Methylosinus sp. Sm6]